MWTLNSGRPTQCLKIGSRTLAWGESSKTWRGRHRYRCVLSPIPQGVVRISPIDRNVINPAALEEGLRALAGPPKELRLLSRTWLSGLPRRMTLVLPDLAVRSTVLQLEHVPTRREEQEALIRWRLGQEQRLPLAGAKLHWQIFPPRHPHHDVHTMLVIAIQESILAEYEGACEAAGLLPQQVTVSSFRLFDLWLKAAGGTRCLTRDLAWLAVSDGALTCLIIHDGRPVFVRTKLLAGDPLSEDESSSHESLGKIVRETELSILACQEHVPNLRLAQLVLMTESDFPGLEDELGHALGLATDQLLLEHVESVGWAHDGGNRSFAVLPIVAGLM